MDQSIGVLKLLSSSVEVAQTCAFPVLVGGFWLGLRKTWLKLPNAAIVSALLIWAFSASYLEGMYPAWAYTGSIVLTQLGNNSRDANLREAYRVYGHHAEQRDLPSMTFIRRVFNGEDDARAWLETSKRPRLLLTGKISWPHVVLSPDAQDYVRGAIPEISTELATEAQKLGLNLKHDAHLFTIPDLQLVFAVQVAPEEFRLPRQPEFLAHEFLGRLALGMNRELLLQSAIPTFDSIQQNALRRDDLLLAASLDGMWRSFAPLAAGSFFVGTHDLLTSYQGDTLDQSTLECALDTLHRGSRRADYKSDAEIFAAIANNRGIARLMDANDGKDIAKAAKSFRLAAAITDLQDQPVLGARLGMLNLLTLERSGLLR